jgi:quinol monooxygenase YgiN
LSDGRRAAVCFFLAAALLYSRAEAAESGPWVVIATIHARPGQEPKVLAILREIVVASRKEPGCLQYEISRSERDPASYVVVEKWAKRSDLERHWVGLAKPMRKIFPDPSRPRQSDLVTGPPVDDVYAPIDP